MAYPKARVGERTDKDAVPSRPSFPTLEAEILAYWEARRDLRGECRGARSRDARRERVRLLRRPAVRQRAAALRPPADRLRQGRRAALPDDARATRRAPLRLGLPRPAGRVRSREAAGHRAQERDRGNRRREVQRRLPHVRAPLHRGVARATSLVRHAGWTSTTTTRRSTCPYMESVMWAFKTLWDKGLIYEGFRVLWYCWRCETPLSNTETKMDDVYRDRQDPAVTVGLPLDVDAGELTASRRSSGRRRRGRCRRTSRPRCIRTSTTSSCRH